MTRLQVVLGVRTAFFNARAQKVLVDVAGKRQEKTLKGRGKVYPAPVLNLYPLMQGVTAGRKYRLQMLDPEEVKLKEVTITALGKETLPGGVEKTVHLRNDLYPFVDNDIWVDLAGNTIRESVRDGLILTSAEDAAAARKFVVEAAIARKELILDFSLVRLDLEGFGIHLEKDLLYRLAPFFEALNVLVKASLSRRLPQPSR